MDALYFGGLGRPVTGGGHLGVLSDLLVVVQVDPEEGDEHGGQVDDDVGAGEDDNDPDDVDVGDVQLSLLGGDSPPCYVIFVRGRRGRGRGGAGARFEKVDFGDVESALRGEIRGRGFVVFWRSCCRP